MSDAQNKPLPPPAEPLPEPSGFGNLERLENSPTRVPPDPPKGTSRRRDLLAHPDFEELRLSLAQHANDLKQQFESLLVHRPIAKAAAEFMTRLLVPDKEAGRPRKADVTEAVRLRREGQPWRVIYIRLGKRSRDEQHALRSAVRTREYRFRHKSKDCSQENEAVHSEHLTMIK